MADHVISKLNPNSHLILDQPLLRLPYELMRKNFKVAHYNVEKESTVVKSVLRETANASISDSASSESVLKSVDSMIARVQGLKRKLNACAEEEEKQHRNSLNRIRHLGELYGIQTLDDVKYEQWSRMRLDRLIVDYLLRNGFQNSAVALAEEKGIEDLVDVDIFVQMNRICQSLKNGRVLEALAWCHENKKELKKMECSLEFVLRFQQYIELVRTQEKVKLLESITHAKRYLLPFRETYPYEVQQACGLLAFPPNTKVSSYATLYSNTRWQILADLFSQTHNLLLSLPSSPLLNIALSAGLSALKTPACHSQKKNVNSIFSSYVPTSSPSLTAPICPICSTELNSLARDVPYAHHTKSHVASDLVMLPDGCVYRKQWLQEYSTKAGLSHGKYMDVKDGTIYGEDELKKLYIS